MPNRPLTSDEVAQLVAAALDVRQRAYAPYSQFQVGAALLGESGRMVCGCNVENVSYGLTNCAERVALGTAVASGEQRFRGLAIATRGGGTPCGACRQVLAEFCDDLPIWLVDATGGRPLAEVRLKDLLPGRFEFEGQPPH